VGEEECVRCEVRCESRESVEGGEECMMWMEVE